MSYRRMLLQRYVNGLFSEDTRRSIILHGMLYGNINEPTAALHVGVWIWRMARLDNGR